MKVKLKEICTPKQWKTISTNELRDSGYPVYGANGIIGYYNEYNHEVDTLLVTCRGATCGSLNISKGKAYVNGNAMALDDLRNDIDIKYLYYYLKCRGFKDVISGSAQPQIIRSSIEEIEVEIKNKEEQESIVSKCERIERLVDKIKKMQNCLDSLIKARFVEMFGDLNNTKYDIKTIEECAIFVKDGTHNTPMYTEDKVNGFKFLSSKDVTSGKIDWSNIKYIPKELHNELYERIKPQKNDILLAKNGTTGICAIVDNDEIFDIYVSLALIRLKEDLNPTYIWTIINSYMVKEQFNKSLKGIGVPNLHLSEIKKVNLIVPPIGLQNSFAAFVNQVDKLKFA